MTLNNQFDENAADFRETQPAADPQPASNANPPQPSQPSSVPLKNKNVSKIEIFLAVMILLGIIAVVYIFLEPSSKSSGTGPQPLPGAWNYPDGKGPSPAK